MKFLKAIHWAGVKSATFAIDFYRKYISCLMLPRCRFHPSCSAYAGEAIKKKGLGQGLALSLKRLLRCHPFSRADFYDPLEQEDFS